MKESLLRASDSSPHQQPTYSVVSNAVPSASLVPVASSHLPSAPYLGPTETMGQSQLG